MLDTDERKNLLFGYLTCRRLLPNYIFFADRYKFGNSEILSQYLRNIKEEFINPEQKADFADFETSIDLIVPLPHNFETVLASAALNACGAIMELIRFYQDKNSERIGSISVFATDTIDMYIQDLLNLDYQDPNFEETISFHPLMLRERKIQADTYHYLSIIRNIDIKDVITLEQLQYNEGRGNLDLPAQAFKG